MAGLNIAFDIGTTTIKAALSPAAGVVALAISRPNPQLRFGTDIIARISAAIDSPASRAELHRDLVATLEDMAGELLAAARGSGVGGAAGGLGDTASGGVGCMTVDIAAGCAVGNPAMYAFLLDIDPSPLGVFPSRLPPQPDRRLSSRELGFERLDFPLFVPAPWRGFVGTDALASLVCFARGGDGAWPALLIDVGTNVEIMLLLEDGRGWLTSVAGGPAFEDLALAPGDGRVDFDPALLALDQGPPGADALPFYGSGVVALLAGLRREGAVEAGGRLARGGTGLDFTYGGRRLRLGQKLIRGFQLSKAALMAATNTLLDLAALTAADVACLRITGLFGERLDYASAVAVGMLPAVPAGRCRAQADMPLLGATYLATDPGLAAARGGFRHVPLDANRRFRDHFNGCMELGPRMELRP